MGKIIRNGIEFSSTVDTANNISYDNSLSGLEATTTQKAIDEVAENVVTEVLRYPDFSNQIYNSGDWAQTFSWTAPQDCWIYALLNTNKNDTSAYIKINDVLVAQLFSTDKNNYSQLGTLVPCKKGDVVSKTTNGTTTARIIVYGVR